MKKYGKPQMIELAANNSQARAVIRRAAVLARVIAIRGDTSSGFLAPDGTRCGCSHGQHPTRWSLVGRTLKTPPLTGYDE